MTITTKSGDEYMIGEKIILGSEVSETEFLRMLARFGKNTFGLRVMSSSELATYALMKSGIVVSERPITASESISFIYDLLQKKTIRYFENSTSYSDAKYIFNSLTLLRSMIVEDEQATISRQLSEGEFVEKNHAVLEVYRLYMDMLGREGRIDSILLVRKAIEFAGTLDLDIIALDEYPLSMLEEKLLDKLSSKTPCHCKIKDIIGANDHAAVKPIQYTRAYGAVNEVEDIFRTILVDKGLSFDKCLVATANPSVYAQLFYDFSLLHNIPVTFGCGIPIINSNPAKMLKQINEWDGPGYNGIEAYRKLVGSEVFNRKKLLETLDIADGKVSTLYEVLDIAGSLRLSFDNKISASNKANDEKIRLYRSTLEKKLSKDESGHGMSGNKELKPIQRRLELLDKVQKFADEIKRGFSAFMGKYCIIRESAGKLDRAALSLIQDMLLTFCDGKENGSTDKIIKDILERSVCKEACREGALHITSIPDSFASMRENLFICGLSSSEFPGKVQENYVLLDSDLDFALKEKYSQKKIKDKADRLRMLVDFSSHIGSRTRISYSCFDLAELKQKNPSSVLLDLFMETNDIPEGKKTEDLFRYVGFFDSGLTPAFDGGYEYSCGKGRREGNGKNQEPVISSEQCLEKYWSPTTLEIFFQCPRRFYLSKILGIPDETPDDPTAVINAADMGTIAHESMELLANNSMTKESFIEMASSMFDDYLTGRPPLNPSDVGLSKEEFIEMMANAYEQYCGNEVILTEEEIREEHPSGIRLKGFPDRIERAKSGAIIVADFKTKRRVDHFTDEERKRTCFQILVYAWLCEKKFDYKSIDCEYRYVRLENSDVKFHFDSSWHNLLDSMLNEFRKAIDDKCFPRNPGENNENCRFCTLNNICNWSSDKAEA